MRAAFLSRIGTRGIRLSPSRELRHPDITPVRQSGAMVPAVGSRPYGPADRVIRQTSLQNRMKPGRRTPHESAGGVPLFFTGLSQLQPPSGDVLGNLPKYEVAIPCIGAHDRKSVVHGRTQRRGKHAFCLLDQDP